jgi:hypothetical protein
MPYGGDINRSSGVVADPPTIFDECSTGFLANPYLSRNPLNYPTNPTNQNNIPPVNSDNATPPQNNGPSQQNLAAPFVGYHERYSWEVDNGIKVFAPKNKGVGKFIYRW